MEFKNLRSKGDFMDFCLNNDNRIKELDSAIPMNLAKQLRDLDLDTSSFAFCYWKNGEIDLLNVVEHSTKLFINK